MAVAENTSLTAEAQSVLSNIRSSFGAIVAALPGEVSRPSEVQQALDLNKKLSWRIAKLINEDDLFRCAQYVPGPGSMEAFLKAAARRDVPESMIRTAREAASRFDRLIEVHAGKRAALEMMLLSCSEEGRRDAARAQQKAAFQANSHIWGVQAQVQLGVYLMHPARDPDRVDIAAIRGFIGLRRNRPEVPWVIARVRCVEGDGALRPPPGFEPLDEVETSEGESPVPLLRPFCSQPLPAARRVPGPDGYLEDEMISSQVGNAGRTTCITAEVARAAVARYYDEQNQTGEMNLRLRTPVEMLLFDLLVHPDLGIGPDLDFAVYGDLNRHEASTERSERDRLSIGESVQRLGRSESAAYTPHVPSYGEMIAWVCNRLGWQRDHFDLYRVRLEYPVIPSTARFLFPLPRRS